MNPSYMTPPIKIMDSYQNIELLQGRCEAADLYIEVLHNQILAVASDEALLHDCDCESCHKTVNQLAAMSHSILDETTSPVDILVVSTRLSPLTEEELAILEEVL